jgi:hypothetical protein
MPRVRAFQYVLAQLWRPTEAASPITINRACGVSTMAAFGKIGGGKDQTQVMISGPTADSILIPQLRWTRPRQRPTLGCGRPERAGQVGSPLRCPWLSILRSRAPVSSRGIFVESVRALTCLARGAFPIAVVFCSFNITAFARDQHILGITHLSFCIQPEAFRDCSSATIFCLIGVEFD